MSTKFVTCCYFVGFFWVEGREGRCNYMYITLSDMRLFREKKNTVIHIFHTHVYSDTHK